MSEQEHLLTDDEHEALDLTGRLANLLRRIVGTGPQADNDWNEAAQRIHAVQHTVMAQAAARAYPDRYRLLGGTIAGADTGSEPHKPFNDDGVTYCGWDGHDGCGEVWPCSTVRAAEFGRTDRHDD